MSSQVNHLLPAVLVGDDASAQSETRSVEVAIAELLRRGFYCRVSHRLNSRRLNWWQRAGYTFFCRRLPAFCRFLPAPLGEKGGLVTFAAADEECVTPDHVLQIMPLGWTYPDDRADPEIACRPRDESDAENYARLKSIFGVAVNYRPLIGAAELRALLEEVAQCRRMAAPRAKNSE